MLRYLCNENHPGCLSNAIKSFSAGRRHIKLFSCLPNFRQSGVSVKMKERYSGILMHISSLPSQFGIGDLGPQAYQFADMLAQNKQHFWQILPLNPTEQKHDNSPYHSFAAFAGNPLFISPELLYQDGLLDLEDLNNNIPSLNNWIDFPRVYPLKNKLIGKACQKLEKLKIINKDFERFCQDHAFWLDDYTLFQVLGTQYPSKGWNEWPSDIKNRNSGTINVLKIKMAEEIKRQKLIQFLFFRQWEHLKNYCHKKKIKIIGDMPIYVTYNSADVWTHPDLFKLDQDKRQLFKAGVPPDYFSQTGQLWGNPVYQWQVHQKEHFSWWMQRIRQNLQLVDWLRIDHFRGLAAYWEIPVNEKTAINGHWIKAPIIQFIKSLMCKFPHLPFIAEDLGIITEDVARIIEKYHFPGMRVLLFAFGDDFPDSTHLPHHHITNCVVYTGTHDNNTIQGWINQELNSKLKKHLSQYLGKARLSDESHWDLIRMAQGSVARLAIIPIQDILGLGEESRMNHPANSQNNWRWQLTSEQISELKKKALPRLKKLSEIYGRDGRSKR